MVVLGGGAVSYERGTPVDPEPSTIPSGAVLPSTAGFESVSCFEFIQGFKGSVFSRMTCSSGLTRIWQLCLREWSNNGQTVRLVK